jgi:hypothetical protein
MNEQTEEIPDMGNLRCQCVQGVNFKSVRKQANQVEREKFGEGLTDSVEALFYMWLSSKPKPPRN